MHVLMVWENRNVFNAEYVKGLRNALFAEQRKHLEMCIEVDLFKKVLFFNLSDFHKLRKKSRKREIGLSMPQLMK